MFPVTNARTPGRRTAVFRGDLKSTMGYGYETRAMASLLPDDFDVFGVDLHPNPNDCDQRFPGQLISDEEVFRLSVMPDRRVSVINNTSPEGYIYFPGAVNIGMFSWETDAIAYKLDWPELIATMDFNWAKTTFHQSCLKHIGIAGGATLVAWPFDFTARQPSTPERLDGLAVTYIECLGDDASGVAVSATTVRRLGVPVLLSVSSMAPRKGLPILLSEWRDHVAAGGEGVLLLKLRPIHNHRLPSDTAAVMADLLRETGYQVGDPVRIAYTLEDLQAEDVRELYRLSDGYVTATYGEGFGGPVVEALILGRPVIAPRHSSLADLLPPGYPLEVECRRLRVGLVGNSPIYPHASSWSLPTRGSLVRAFAAFAGMSQETRHEVMAQARSYAEAFCSQPVVAEALRRFFDGLETR